MIKKSEFQHTAASAGIIGLTALGGSVIGFFLQLLIAYYFGATRATDAFFMAQSTSELLNKLLLGGSITAVFIPIFIELLARGQRREAWIAALNVIHVATIFFTGILLAVAIFTQPLISFLAPGFDPATQQLTIRLVWVLIPSFLFYFLVELLTSILYSLKRFVIPALLRIVSPVASITMVALFAPLLGIYSLALGALFASLLQVGFLMWALHREDLPYQFVFSPADPLIRRLVNLAYPFIFSVLVTQAAGVVYRILVSRLNEGSLAALKFAEKISQLLAILFLSSVTTVIYPVLSEKASRQDFAGMRETIGSALRLITVTTVPAIIGVALLRLPLTAFLFQRGSFSVEDTAQTSLALLFLVVGLTMNGISSVLGHAVLALQQTRAAVAVTTASQAIALFLFVLLVPPLAQGGLALASSIVPAVIAFLYFLFLTRFISQLPSIFWHSTYLKIACLAVLLFIIIRLTSVSTGPLFLQLLIPSTAGTLVFFGGAYLWRVPEITEALALIRGKLQKVRANIHGL